MPGRGVTPRCGRPMRRYEAVWGALPEEPECGRPEDHTGQCRSSMALKRDHEKNLARQRRRKRARRLHVRLAAVVELAAAEAARRAA